MTRARTAAALLTAPLLAAALTGCAANTVTTVTPNVTPKTALIPTVAATAAEPTTGPAPTGTFETAADVNSPPGIDLTLKADLRSAHVLVETVYTLHPDKPLTEGELPATTAIKAGALVGYPAFPGTTLRLLNSQKTKNAYCLGAYNKNASTATNANTWMKYESATGLTTTKPGPFNCV